MPQSPTIIPRIRHARLRFTLSLLLLNLFGNSPALATETLAEAAGGYYSYSTPSSDGIGKFYMGREISHVMGHRGAGWLERDGREKEERTDLLIDGLGLSGSEVVADIGAGTGYFAFRLSPLVPLGRVMAVDIQQEMLDIIAQRTTARHSNIVPVLGSIKDIGLPADSVDLILMVDAYHEFSHPREMGESMFRALKPGGRIALVEYRAEDPAVPIKRLHKMTQSQAIREMSALGLHWEVTSDALPQQHLMFFIKAPDDNGLQEVNE